MFGKKTKDNQKWTIPRLGNIALKDKTKTDNEKHNTKKKKDEKHRIYKKKRVQFQ